MPYKKWTQKELNILRKHYLKEQRDVNKRLPKRSRIACKGMAVKLGLTKDTRVSWSEEELSILKRYYCTEGGVIWKRLPGRTYRTCRSKAAELGLKCKKSHKAWTDKEEEILEKYYSTEGLHTYKRLPGRTKVACTTHARKMGLLSSFKETVNGGHNPHYWTEEEKDLLRQYYPKEGTKSFKRISRKCYDACAAQVKRFKLRNENLPNPWSKEEDEIIKKYYPLEGSKMHERLSERTQSSASARAHRLKIRARNYLIEQDNKILYKMKYTPCPVCGWDRGSLEMAHIVPARDGGPAVSWNTVGLCRNCHWLFDKHELKESEIKNIEKQIKKAKQKFAGTSKEVLESLPLNHKIRVNNKVI